MALSAQFAITFCGPYIRPTLSTQRPRHTTSSSSAVACVAVGCLCAIEHTESETQHNGSKIYNGVLMGNHRDLSARFRDFQRLFTCSPQHLLFGTTARAHLCTAALLLWRKTESISTYVHIHIVWCIYDSPNES